MIRTGDDTIVSVMNLDDNLLAVCLAAREVFIDNLLVRIHFIIVMIGWTGLAPWEFELPFPGSLTSTLLWLAGKESMTLLMANAIATDASHAAFVPWLTVFHCYLS